MNKLESYKVPTHLPDLSHCPEAASLLQNYQDYFAKIEQAKAKIARIDSRLAHFDPSFAGQERKGLPFKYYLSRVSHAKEIGGLNKAKRINKRLISNFSKKVERLEMNLKKFTESDIRTQSDWNLGSPALFLATYAKAARRMVTSVYSWRQQKTSATPEPVKSPEENRKEVLNFIGEAPVFKENPRLRKMLESCLRLPEDIQVKVLGPEKIQVLCSKRRVEIDPTLAVDKEECERVDPNNRLLKTEGPITVDHLTRYGTIDPEWWEWLKVKQYPSFGPKVILKREGDTLRFLKGASLLDAIELREKQIVFRALFLEKACDWKIEDFLGFLTKFKSIPVD